MTEMVSIIGLGNMGAALASSFLEAGHEVTVWNRTNAKADSLVDRGATRAKSSVEAINSSPVTVACVGQYQHLYESFAATDESFRSGRALVNLTWGTPEEAERMDAWAGERGLYYLDGGIPVYPSSIGAAETELIFSGPRKLWEQYNPILCCLGGASRLLSEDIGSANAMSLAMPGIFYHGAYAAFFEAAAFMGRRGIPVSELRTQVQSALQLLDTSIEESITKISEGQYETDQATVDIQLEAIVAARDAVRGEGQQGTLASAVISIFGRGVAAGQGSNAAASLYPMLRDGA